jgi:hypothetical protein
LQKLLIYISIILLSARCAQITPLTGGKRDMSPPVVKEYRPANASVNFNTQTIYIEFDEYIALKDISSQFIITPQTKEPPEIQVTGKKMKVTFNEPLLPNTTYKLAFGNAVSDINEGNILQNFEYILSTGNSIDSLRLKGKVLSALDGKPSNEVLVGLYPKDSKDSVMYTDKPLYITKADVSGNFAFNHLPAESFKILAIKDQNKNLLYDGSEEQIAFTTSNISTLDTNLVTLNLFKEAPSKNFIRKPFSPDYGKAVVVYNKPQEDIVSVIAKGMIDYELNAMKDTLSIFYQDKFDTLQTIINYHSRKADTLQIKLINKGTYEKRIKNKDIKFVLQTNIAPEFPFYSQPEIRLNVPVRSNEIDRSRITLFEKTDSVFKPKALVVVCDTGWVTRMAVKTELKIETGYRIIIDSKAFSSADGRFNDSIAYHFVTTAQEDHAQLNLKLFFPKKENYLVRLLNEKEQIIDERKIALALMSPSEQIIEYKNLMPGNYFVRVVEDVNKNGRFDTGNYFLKLQPETIFINPSSIKLLSGWEVENEWIVK